MFRKVLRKVVLVVLISVLVALIAYVGYLVYRKFNPLPNPTAENPAGLNTIDITGDGFSPRKYSVREGTQVTWVNRDVQVHTVTFDDFGSAEMQPQDIFTHLFDQKGTYRYKCDKHPKETGVITVK